MNVEPFNHRFVKTWRDHGGALLFRKSGRKISGAARTALFFSRDHFLGSYEQRRRLPADLRSFIGTVPLTDAEFSTLSRLGEHYVAHRFDLLGSGWTQVSYGMRCRGFDGVRFPAVTGRFDASGDSIASRLNRPNVRTAAELRHMIEQPYRPIDWQLDFKSGYRWSERTWYRKIRYGRAFGADVKVPWELGRMQHLPQLALVAGDCRRRGLIPHADRYQREIRNQILDFIAQNPPRFGVNWSSTMDVALRGVSFALSLDLCGGPQSFDREFTRIVTRSLYEHGKHIALNLEWDEILRGNHYLSNIVGLLFIAAYLPASQETARWMSFATTELVAEVRQQFNEDGSNFEGSTSYHCLTTEMVLWATALLARQGGCTSAAVAAQPSLPDWFGLRLRRATEFLRDVTKPTGEIVQIGDNDSGRFVKMSGPYKQLAVADAVRRFANLDGYSELPGNAEYLWFDARNTTPLLSAANALLGFDPAAEALEARVIARLAGIETAPRFSIRTSSSPERSSKDGQSAQPDSSALDFAAFGTAETMTIQLPFTTTAEHFRLASYPDFGVLIVRSPRFLLTIRCGGKRVGTAGHFHDDQLSVDLTVEGHAWLEDPGTFIYTPLPAKRNAYRSGTAHWRPQLCSVSPPTYRHLFSLTGAARGECIFFSAFGFLGRLSCREGTVHRHITWANGQIVITDYSAHAGAAYRIPARVVSGPIRKMLAVSPSYGVIER